MKASVREVKWNLSKFLLRAKAGEQLIVTSRGKPVARLLGVIAEPVQKKLAPAEVARRLKAIPGMIPGEGGKPRGSRRPPRVKAGQKTLARVVLEDRR